MKTSFVQLRPSIVIKTAIYTLLSVLLISITSSFLPALGYTGARADLVLCAVIALAYFESEKFAAIFGMLTGFALESVGSTGVCILPLFYMLTGCICALLFSRFLGKNFGIYMLYISLFSIVRIALTLILTQLELADLSLDLAFSEILLWEYLCTVLSAPILFFTIMLISKRTNPKKDIQEMRV